MLYTGPAFSAAALGDGIVELKFDLAGESVNKLNAAALQDFAAATQAIAKDGSVKGVVVTSGKSVFIVGADITEFGAMFAAGEEGIAKSVLEVNRMLSAFEDLPVPTVIAINGVCLGGGLELALAGDYRVMSTAASVGFPEVKLGIFPGFGGSVRMPRIIGVDNAVEWICAGADKKADAALKDGAVDAVVAPEQLRDAALAMLQAVHRRQARLAGPSRRQARAAQAQQDGTDDGVHVVDGRGRRAGRPQLPGADARAQEHAGSGHARPRRRARSRGEVLRQGRRHAAGERADRRLPRRPGRQEGRGQLGEEEQARDQAGGRARRRHHGRRHRLPGGAQGHADHHEGHQGRAARARHERGRQAAREAGRAGQVDAGEDDRDARPHPPDAELRRLRRRRHHHRGGGREPEGQEGGARRGRRPRARGHDHRVQHLDDLDQPAGRRA